MDGFQVNSHYLLLNIAFLGKVVSKSETEVIAEDDNRQTFKIKREAVIEVHPSCLG